MMRNRNLCQAKKVKNDEFYTLMEDIEKELPHYKKHFKNKVVLCNCDDPEKSNFYGFFVENFKEYGLKRLICTYYKYGFNESFAIIYNGNDFPVQKRALKCDGDFRSDECLEYLKEADIVVTNPPFSLFREYVKLLMDYKKKFLIIGSKNSVIYKDIFSLFKNNKVWFGFHSVNQFVQPDKTLKHFGNIGWFTNLKINKQNNEIIMFKTYKGNEKYYPKYNNFDAINVNRLVDIPKDYDGIMGVPITFLEKYNPEQFEIVGTDTKEMAEILGIRPIGQQWCDLYFSQGKTGHMSPKMKNPVLLVNGEAVTVYKRIFIRIRKK